MTLKDRMRLGPWARTLIHAAWTAVAAAVSLLAARLFKLPEAYWAPITTLIVTQSTLGAALIVSGQRLAGTALGAVAGALLSVYVGSTAVALAVGIFGLGVLCAILHLDRAAYRFAGITLIIVVLVSHQQTAWVVAIHRFFEVSVGIVIGLVMSALWPEQEAKGSPR